jgi:hypothetical protein
LGNSSSSRRRGNSSTGGSLGSRVFLALLLLAVVDMVFKPGI